MNLRILKKIFGFVALIGIVSLCGCGGGGGGGATPTQVNPAADPNLAPAVLTGLTLTFQDPDITSLQTSYTFTASDFTTPRGDSGSYTYSRVLPVLPINQATLQLNSSFATVLHYDLTFTSKSTGTYFDSSTSKTSTFTVH